MNLIMNNTLQQTAGELRCIRLEPFKQNAKQTATRKHEYMHLSYGGSQRWLYYLVLLKRILHEINII